MNLQYCQKKHLVYYFNTHTNWDVCCRVELSGHVVPHNQEGNRSCDVYLTSGVNGEELGWEGLPYHGNLEPQHGSLPAAQRRYT